MKKLCSTALMLSLCFAFLAPARAAVREAVTAIPTNHAIVLSNSTVQPDAHLVHPTVYLIEGSNYCKLRDLAMLLNGSERQFAVGYDSAAKTVSIARGKAYKAVGGELSGAAVESVSAAISDHTIVIDGTPATLEAFLIDGVNYFKLRDLGKALDFYVGFDGETKMVFLSGAKPYVDE